MVLGKNYRLSIRRNVITSPSTGHRSDKVTFLLEHRTNKDIGLAFESGTIIALNSSDEIENFKSVPTPSGTTSTGFKMCNEAYGVLGILTVAANFSSSSSFNTFTGHGHQSAGHGHFQAPIQYLVIVTGIVSVGKILEQEIFRITDTGFISLRGVPSDGDKIKEIRNILISGTFYFSIPLSMTSSIKSASAPEVPYDITNCIQRMVKINNNIPNLASDSWSPPSGYETLSLAASQTTDNRFFWNRSLYLPFIRSNIDTNKWLIKTMCGSVVMATVYVGAKQVKAALISRLSKERTGTRFNVRGVNDDGSVANFVETEQIMNYDNYVTSYVMIRGSVPLFWSQPGVNVGSHKVKLTRGSEISQPCYDKHVANLIKRYGNQHFITLCGHKEGELNLTRMYRAHHKVFISKFEHIPLTIFDYHANCPKGKEENLTLKLFLEISENLSNFGLFSAILNTSQSCIESGSICGQVLNQQTGVFRVNCIDCLDRTNRVQTFIGLQMMERQLSSINLLDKDRDKTLAKFKQVLETLWPSNGDQVSRIYSGTGALEGKSKLKDSTLSVARTIQNNLLDSSKQEAIDVLLFGKSLSAKYIEKCRNFLSVNQISHLDPNILVNVCNRYKDYTSSTRIKVVVSTYNVAGGKNFMYKTSIPLSDWLVDYKSKGVGMKRSPSGSRLIPTNNGANAGVEVPNIMDMSLSDQILSNMADAANGDNNGTPDDGLPDIYAIGFEEIVDLNAGNIVAASTSNQREWLIEIQKVISQQTNYVLVTSVQLVGVCLYIFIRPKHCKYIKDVSTDTVKTGLGGAAGNKGGVAVKFTLHATSICFICSHFAAGQSAVNERNSDYQEISKKLAFSSLTCGETSSLNCLDYIFWCGDFNYRINLDNDTVRGLIADNNLETLKLHDQLLNAKSEGKVFQDFIEGCINFDPTYKYDTNSDDYDTSEKQRVPAWTDRILYKKNEFITGVDEDGDKIHGVHDDDQDAEKSGKLNFYGRSELKTSDHRPVVAEIMVDILKVDADRRHEVLIDCIKNFGPPDATIVVSIFDADNQMATDADELTDIFTSDLIDYFMSKAGVDIASHRKAGNNISMTLRNGRQCLKLVRVLNNSVYSDKYLKINLASEDYVNQTMDQLRNLDNNIIPLTDAVSNVDIERIEKEAEVDIGPEVDPRIFCVADIDDADESSSSASGRNSPSNFFDKPTDFDRTPIPSCHTSPVHSKDSVKNKPGPSRPPGPATVPGRPPPPPPTISQPINQDAPPKLVPARAAPPPPVKVKIVHQQALNPPTIMTTHPSTDSDKGSSFETETPPATAKDGVHNNPLKTKPPPVPKCPDPVHEASSVWTKEAPTIPGPNKQAPPIPTTIVTMPSTTPGAVKVTPTKPGFKDLFASESFEAEDDPFADNDQHQNFDPFKGEDPFKNDPFAAESSFDTSAFDTSGAESSFNVSAPKVPPPPPPVDVSGTGFDTSVSAFDTSDFDSSFESGPPPPMSAPPPPPVPSSPAPGSVLPNGGPNRGPPPTVPSRGPPPSVPPRRGV